MPPPTRHTLTFQLHNYCSKWLQPSGGLMSLLENKLPCFSPINPKPKSCWRLRLRVTWVVWIGFFGFLGITWHVMQFDSTEALMEVITWAQRPVENIPSVNTRWHALAFRRRHSHSSSCLEMLEMEEDWRMAEWRVVRSQTDPIIQHDWTDQIHWQSHALIWTTCGHEDSSFGCSGSDCFKIVRKDKTKKAGLS